MATLCHVREDQQWRETAQKWLTIHQQIKELEVEEQKLRAALIELAGNQNTMGNGVKLSRLLRKGSVDYSKIPELKDVDLDKYRKGSLETWRLVPFKEASKSHDPSL